MAYIIAEETVFTANINTIHPLIAHIGDTI